jgi:hypothetical protein
VFLYSPQETLPVHHTVGSILGVLWNRTEMSCQFNFEQTDEGTWRRKAILRSEGLVRKLPQKWLETGWGGLRGRAYTVQPIRKELIGMSQLAHCHWNLDSPEAAPAWPVAMAAQPAKQEEPGRRCPCFLWKISQLCVS